MAFNALDGILNIVAQHPDWDRYRQYRRLLQIWPQAIDPKAIPHTRPLQIKRDILWVATSSATWAQILSLSRPSLLAKLNCHLDPPLVDIRFSSARWSQQPVPPAIAPAHHHPSHIQLPEPLGDRAIAATALPDAFQTWLNRLQARSLYLEVCPRCQSPSPSGEIERWSCCAYCIRQQWSNSPPSPNNLTQ